MSYGLIRAGWEFPLDLTAFADESSTHPELIRRLVTLGLLDARQDPAGELWFSRGQLAALGRVQRLHAGFALNYAAIGLVTDLLDRIAALEAALRSAHISQGQRPIQAVGQRPRRPGGRPWTRVI
ncbi:MAG TPA: chaperone modulator CbpM [Streptosporangiaceae bacterium]|nr:chaperone modulator CbpM [Streptosporangiaceae bacterium]